MRCIAREFYRNADTYADRLFCSEDTFAVADGMGPGVGARTAAEKAIELVNKYRPFTSSQDIEKFFKRANLKIMEETQKLGDRHISGTTLSVISFLGDSFVMGHVGDSRIYRKRKGELELLTSDQVEIRNGKKYISALGIDWKLNVVTREDEALPGDIFLLISDGVVESISDEEIARALKDNIEESAEKLLSLYKEHQSEEDMSFVIVLIR